jgi:UDP-glucose 4-epimerase
MQVEMVAGDVRDRAALEAVIAPGTDAVIWGAAITADAARDAAEPEAVLDTNLGALAPVLRRARDVGVRRVVNLGSVAAYGEAAFREAPLAEDDPVPDPRSLYALTKFGGERLCARLAELWRCDIVSLRLSSVFGPWERMTGARDTPSPFMQMMALAERGGEARLARPAVRDWIHAADVAAAVVLLLGAPRLAHRLYNVGPGKAFPVLDWGRLLAARRAGFECRLAASGESPNVDLQGPRDRALLASGRLAEETGFVARYGLAESVAQLDDWARAHPGWFAGKA